MDKTFKQSDGDAVYHAGIGQLLKAAYGREFTQLEKGKCKMKFVTFEEWWETLNDQQKQRVNEHIEICYGRRK